MLDEEILIDLLDLRELVQDVQRAALDLDAGRVRYDGSVLAACDRHLDVIKRLIVEYRQKVHGESLEADCAS